MDSTKMGETKPRVSRTDWYPPYMYVCVHLIIYRTPDKTDMEAEVTRFVLTAHA